MSGMMVFFNNKLSRIKGGNINLMKQSALIVFFILSTSTSFAADGISRNDWIKNMSAKLPVYFCQQEQIFRQCFKVTQAECQETASSASRVCLDQNKHKIPTHIRKAEVGAYWGTVIGSCAGVTYEKILKKKRINNSKCNNPNNW
jgi:hypothetical protein